MKAINASYEIVDYISPRGSSELRRIEDIARTCYKSTPRAKEGESEFDVTKRFIKHLIVNGHEAMLEHSQLAVKFTCDRGISHELVRHRMASFAQESTRWCNYSQDKFGNELTFIKPYFFTHGDSDKGCEGLQRWTEAMEACEKSYMDMLNLGFTPQEARSVLPNSLKTEIFVTANYREWRHLLRLRCAPDAHPQMKELMIPLLFELRKKIQVVFDDIDADWKWYAEYINAKDIEVFANDVVPIN